MISTEMTQIFASTQLYLGITHQVTLTGLNQWKIFMKNYRDWFGLRNSKNEYEIDKFTSFALKIIEGNIHFGQQARSQALSAINRVTI